MHVAKGYLVNGNLSRMLNRTKYKPQERNFKASFKKHSGN